MSTLDYATDPMLCRFVELTDGRARILVRRGYEEHAGSLGLGGDPESDEMVGGGRAAHPLVELTDGERVLVRRYRRGGAVRHVNAATYFAGRRSYHELWVTERARIAGVRVPVIVAAAERRGVVGYAAWLASCWIPDALDLVAWLAAGSPEAGAGVLRSLGREIRVMHQGGIAHPDLNLRNVLVTGVGAHHAVHLIDFDRGRVFAGPVPERRRRADLARLERSARKLGALVTPAGWRALREGYGRGWPRG